MVRRSPCASPKRKLSKLSKMYKKTCSPSRLVMAKRRSAEKSMTKRSPMAKKGKSPMAKKGKSPSAAAYRKAFLNLPGKGEKLMAIRSAPASTFGSDLSRSPMSAKPDLSKYGPPPKRSPLQKARDDAGFITKRRTGLDVEKIAVTKNVNVKDLIKSLSPESRQKIQAMERVVKPVAEEDIKKIAAEFMKKLNKQ